MRQLPASTYLAGLLIATGFSCHAQDLATLQQKLVSQYALTQPTAALDDIVTAGAVVVLQKGNLVMVPVASTNLCQNTYKNGTISQNALYKADKARSIFGKVPMIGSAIPGSSSVPGMATRTFVTGEKMWVTKIEVRDDGVVFGLFTDAIKDSSGNDVRYKADLKFQFPKGSTPSTEDAQKLVAAVLTVQPSDNANSGDKQQSQNAAAGSKSIAAAQPAAASAAAAEAAPPPIAPPPPPPADPKSISLGQTPDQVAANFGQPERIVKLGAKQIYAYKDMKVTFTNGKVSDVQ